MIVRKVRGQNKLQPILVTSVEVRIAKKLGVPIAAYVKEYVMQIAKQRRWKWYFEGVK